MMYGKMQKTNGLTLIEMTLVVATIALLVGFALPAVQTLIDAFQSEGSVKSMINAALSSARAMAVNGQRYVGIRFQMACVSNDPLDPLKGQLGAPQYMVFIAHEERAVLNLSNGFRAVEGLEPIELPDTVGVMEAATISADADIDEPAELANLTTFSLVFSPSGKLVVHDVRVRNRDGQYRPMNDAGSLAVSLDKVFNSAHNIITYGQGLLLQDDYSKLKNLTQGDAVELGLGEEPSRTSLRLYDRRIVRRDFVKQPPGWSQAVTGPGVPVLYVSPYTGSLILPK
jgi:type II secretory pathway pseudopilin PulG